MRFVVCLSPQRRNIRKRNPSILPAASGTVARIAASLITELRNSSAEVLFYARGSTEIEAKNCRTVVILILVSEITACYLYAVIIVICGSFFDNLVEECG